MCQAQAVLSKTCSTILIIAAIPQQSWNAEMTPFACDAEVAIGCTEGIARLSIVNGIGGGIICRGNGASKSRDCGASHKRRVARTAEGQARNINVVQL
jgi:hypothetical protein